MPTSNPTGPPPTLKCTDCNRDFDPVAHTLCPYCESLKLFEADLDTGIQEALRMRNPQLSYEDLRTSIKETCMGAYAMLFSRYPQPESGSTILALARKLRDRVKANVPEGAGIKIQANIHQCGTIEKASRIARKITGYRDLLVREHEDCVWICHEEPFGSGYPSIEFLFYK